MDLVVGASNDAVKSLVNKLGSLLAQEYTLIRGVRDDIQYITDELASMQAFLNRLKRAQGRHDEQRLDWMKQVREVSYDIEDCVDDVDHRISGEPRGSGMVMYVRKKWYLLTTLYARHCIATEIGNLKTRAQHVSERRMRYGVKELEDGDGCPAGASAPRDIISPPPQLIGTTEPVGLEDAKNELKPWFMEVGRQSTHGQPKFIAIVGFGGLGKTTLAMALYREFGEKFDCRACVLASQKFHLPTVLKSLIKQVHEQQSSASKNDLDEIDEWSEEVLKKKLADLLKEKRDSFTKNQKGGTIVVTTRFKSVSEACRRHQGHVFEHQPLHDGNSYSLFLEIISSAADALCPARPINGEIIKKTCRGLPLAIVVVAGLVAKGVTHILSYCYNNLPADLKTSLLYMSMFPKGCQISRKRLIRRWIAEGFISDKHGKTVEEVAEDCFNELISRNLIRAVNNSSNGKVKSCQIHDMVLEYIVSKSSEENFITVVGGHWQTPFPSYKVRRLSVQKSNGKEKEMVERMKLSHVRSLTALGSLRALHSTLHKFQILQMLDLEGCKDLSLNQLKKICKMHQLKYLSLRRTDVEEIPSKISRLESLEVLDIRETSIIILPESVDKLQRMEHLLAGNKNKRHALKLTEGITKMMALQTLSGVEICAGFSMELLRALQDLTNLKKFIIYKVGCTIGNYELLLSAIEHLSSCSLKYLAIDDDFTGFLDTSLNASQAPPEHLHTLGLSGKLSQVPKWIGSLHNLEKLTLSLTSLTTDTLSVLAELPQLFSLIFSLDSTKKDASVLKILHDNTLKSSGMIFVPAGGFRKLKLLCFAAPVLPPLSFLEGAMPWLQRIELRFRMVEGVYGLENLSSIQQVVLTVSSQAPEDAKAKASQVKKLASMIPGKVNVPSVVIDEYNESAE
uniref:Rx N-terminal domain-containing protein n=1 Tax=Setaria italica TaxID=4555 RepID=K3ZNX0_SETIT